MQVGWGTVNATSGYFRYPSNTVQRGEEQPAAPPQSAQTSPEKTANGATSGNDELTADEERVVAELKKRDQEVRAHEAAHMGAGGGIVRGGASFSYQAGPDGRRYAVGGEVGIDMSPVKNSPEATIRKMQQVRAAALAPANPSGQDRSVASAAATQEAQARRELAEESSNVNMGEGAAQSGGSEPSSRRTAYEKQKTTAAQNTGMRGADTPAVDLVA